MNVDMENTLLFEPTADVTLGDPPCNSNSGRSKLTEIPDPKIMTIMVVTLLLQGWEAPKI